MIQRLLRRLIFLTAILIGLLVALSAIGQSSGTMEMHYDLEVRGNVKSIIIEGLLPQDITNRQRVANIRFSTDRAKSIEKNNCRYFQIELHDLKNEKISFTAEYDIELFEYDWQRAKELEVKEPESEAVLHRHLQLTEEEETYQSLKRAAKTISGSSPIAMLEQINNYVSRQLHYDNSLQEDLGVDRALKLGKGDCTEYSQVFVALCKMKSIPARMIGGLISNSTSDNAAHNWVEVYFHDYGWIPLDPTAIDVSSGSAFHEVRNNYIYLSRGEIGNELITGNTKWEWSGKKGSEVVLNCSYEYSDALQKKYDRAVYLYSCRDFNESQVLLNELFDIDGQNVNYHCLQSIINAKRNMLNLAFIDLQKAAQLSKSKAQRSIVLYHTAKYYAQQAEIPKCVEYLEKALENGYDDVLKMRNDLDFVHLRTDASFQRLFSSQ